jgi:hypothetical protein
MWKISKHALERIEERGFSKEDVLNVLNAKFPLSIRIHSPIDEDVELFLGYSGTKHMLIPVNVKTGNVITVRPMRREERLGFDKRTKE